MEQDALQLASDRTVRLAARLLDAPLAALFVEGEAGYAIAATHGDWRPSSASLQELVDELCGAEPAQGPRALKIANLDGTSIDVACTSLLDRSGRRRALLCVSDPRPRYWDERDLQALQDLGDAAAAEIELIEDRAPQTQRSAEKHEAELRASEMRFALVFHAHPLPMTIHDFPAGRYLDVNDAWLAQTGFSREEAIGKTSIELDTYVDPSVRARMFQLLSERRSVRGLEADMRMKNGEVRRFLLASQRVDIAGETRLLSGIQDITERTQANAALRASEEQLRLITHALPIYILHCDTEFRYKFVNTAYAARLGVAPDALLGKRIREVLGEDVWATVADKLDRVLHGELVQYEARIPYPKLGTRFMRSVNVPERDADGHVRGLIGVLIDVSEQKQMEEERVQLLQQSIEQAAQLRTADRRKDEFLAMLAHELRNPLAPINTAAQLLPRLVRDEPQARQVTEIVQRQVKHMTRLVEDLLDVSRITLGKITLRREEVEVAQIVHAAIELTRPLIKEKHHDVIITLPAEPLLVVGDPTRLAQVISNLLNNAAKYTEEHGRIALSAERQAQQVVIKVADNGIGIAAELLPQVFELFTQAERTLDRSQGGLGIGLALVKSLVAMHGGSVEARSDGPRMGTEFTVHLPLSMQTAAAQGTGAIALKVSKPYRILVVDDNVDAADSLAMLLRSEGHELSVAYDAATALESARRERPDVLLLDIGLPGTDGYALARSLRTFAELRDSRFIAATGYGLAEDRERSKAAGFDHHLVKPIDIAVLLDLLRTLQPRP